jgi:hypothetical protein
MAALDEAISNRAQKGNSYPYSCSPLSSAALMEPTARLHEYRPKRQPGSPHGFHEGCHQGDLLEDMDGRRLLGRERQPQVTERTLG